MPESISIHEARKLVLLSQRLPSAASKGKAKDATLAAIEHLGYIQIDTISVIERAHHHTLWNRNPRYQPSQLDQLVEERQVFEYWSHAASYLPMRDYRFTLRKKQALASGLEEHWFDRNAAMEKRVLKRIHDEGPLMAKDFESKDRSSGEWKAKPAKQALENLLMQGDLMSCRRVNFHKVYDLTDRVIPEGTDTSLPSPEDQARYLANRFLRANGVGLPAEVSYLLKGKGTLVKNTMQEMLSAGELMQIRVGKENYYSLPGTLELLNARLARRKARILSPFDNLVIQRKRMQALFDFDYLIECYLPAAKRRYGYFALPVLWDGRLAARMDCKADRKNACLHIHHLALEPWLGNRESFYRDLVSELSSFLAFNRCSRLCIHKTSPLEAITALLEVIKTDNLIEVSFAD
ncbi:MAG: winged helix DNA-binding domain-containing protein [Verrucomicrobiales bacterium]|nr:winged helix DNA-binding domain-containing protein [Verrucomicrobiales bacterium]